MLQAKNPIRENIAKKTLLLRKQTPPTNAFYWVNSQITGPVGSGKVYFRYKPPRVLQCAQRTEGGNNFLFFGARFSLKLITLAKWERRKRKRTLQLLGKLRKEGKESAAEKYFNGLSGYNDSSDSSEPLSMQYLCLYAFKFPKFYRTLLFSYLDFF